MSTLFQLTAEFQHLTSKLIESEGEISPEIEQHLSELERDILKKADSISFIKSRLKQESEFWQSKAETYQKLKRSCDRVSERLTDMVKTAMRKMEMWELKTKEERFVLSPMKQKLVVENETVIPREFFKEIVSFELDKGLLTDALRKGVEVPGAHLEDVIALRIYPRKGTEK